MSGRLGSGRANSGENRAGPSRKRNATPLRCQWMGTGSRCWLFGRGMVAAEEMGPGMKDSKFKPQTSTKPHALRCTLFALSVVCLLLGLTRASAQPAAEDKQATFFMGRVKY